MKNKGFSLIELLVAVAIAGIIALMLSFMLMQGTGVYSKESDKIGVRNDYQIVRNMIEETIMEAKSLVIVRTGEDIAIYTGSVNKANNHLTAVEDGSATTERVITFDKSEGKLYISSDYEQDLSEGNLICTTVKEFDIILSDKCHRYVDDADHSKGEYYVNPFSVDIKLLMEGKSDKLSPTLSIRLRNIIRDVTVYTTDSRITLLNNATKEENFKVK